MALDSSEMHGGHHPTVEPTISVKLPCQECGGRGFVETVSEAGHVVADTAQECVACGGKGLIPDDMPLSQFRELLKIPLARRFARRS
jgi:predicted NBD/HSP70 family sugar kinase